MKHTAIVISVLCGAIACSKFVSSARADNQIAESFGQDRLFESIRADDEVIVGSIDKVTPSPIASKSLHEGAAVVNVRVWLRGSGGSQLVLPYVYEREGVPLKARLLYTWPAMESFRKGQLLLCIFKPGASDRFAPTVAGADGAASLVDGFG